MKRKKKPSKVDVSFYKEISRELFKIPPEKIHEDKRKYNRKREKRKWKKEVEEVLS